MGCGQSNNKDDREGTVDRDNNGSEAGDSVTDDEFDSTQFDADSRLRRRSMAVRSTANQVNFKATKPMGHGFLGTTSKGKFTAAAMDPLLVNFTPQSGDSISSNPNSVSNRPQSQQSNGKASTPGQNSSFDPSRKGSGAGAKRLPCVVKEVSPDSQIVQLALQCMEDPVTKMTDSWVQILGEVERQQQLLMRVTNPSVVETLGVTVSGTTLKVATMFSVPLQPADYEEFTAADVRGVLKDVLTGFVGLHNHGLTHGNVKRANILGSHEESNMNEFLLVDGGYHPLLNRISRRKLWDETRQHCQGYYPPEFLDEIDTPPAKMQKVIDQQKIDIWALGCFGYELIFGKPPFLEGDTIESTARHIREHRTDIPVDYKRGQITVSAQLRDCVLSLLEKDPAKRPTAVSALRHPLFLRSKPTSGTKMNNSSASALGSSAGYDRGNGLSASRSSLHHGGSSARSQVHEADFSAMSNRAMSMHDISEANGRFERLHMIESSADHSGTNPLLPNTNSGNSTGTFGSRMKPTQQESNGIATEGSTFGVKVDGAGDGAVDSAPSLALSQDDENRSIQRPLGDDDDDIMVISDDVVCQICKGSIVPVAYRCTHAHCRNFVVCSQCHRGGIDPSRHDPEHLLCAVVVEEMDERKMSVALGVELGLSVLNRGSPQPDHTIDAEAMSESGSCASEGTPYALPIEVTKPSLAGGGGAGAGAATHHNPLGGGIGGGGPASNLSALSSGGKKASKFSVLVASKSLTSHEQAVFGMTGQLPESKLDVAKKPTQGKCSLMSGFQPGQGASTEKKEGVADDGFTVDDVMAECRNGKSDMNLHAMYLTMVPQVCYDPPLPHIMELDLSSNSLTKLPHEISFLTSLKKLHLGNNQLTELPDSIGDLCELEVLEAHHNNLVEIPQQLMFAEKLQTLSLDYNQLTQFPEVCFAMENLSTLYLASNLHITKWPAVDDLKQLPDIEIGLDNQPHLYSRYQTMQGQIPNVRVLWHKIYPDSIIPNLYCGSLRSAQTPLVYEALKIKHILTMGRGLEPFVGPGMRQKGIMVDDIPGANIEETFEEAIEFIDVALQQGEGCLVHCFAGMSRSATACIAYLMMRRGMRLDEAYVTVKRGRPAIYPNVGFFNQMLALDERLYPNSRPLDMESMERDNVPLA